MGKSLIPFTFTLTLGRKIQIDLSSIIEWFRHISMGYLVKLPGEGKVQTPLHLFFFFFFNKFVIVKKTCEWKNGSSIFNTKNASNI